VCVQQRRLLLRVGRSSAHDDGPGPLHKRSSIRELLFEELLASIRERLSFVGEVSLLFLQWSLFLQWNGRNFSHYK